MAVVNGLIVNCPVPAILALMATLSAVMLTTPVVALTTEPFVKVPVPAMKVMLPEPVIVLVAIVMPPDACWMVTFFEPKSTASVSAILISAVPVLRPIIRLAAVMARISALVICKVFAACPTPMVVASPWGWIVTVPVPAPIVVLSVKVDPTLMAMSPPLEVKGAVIETVVVWSMVNVPPAVALLVSIGLPPLVNVVPVLLKFPPPVAIAAAIVTASE